MREVNSFMKETVNFQFRNSGLSLASALKVNFIQIYKITDTGTAFYSIREDTVLIA